MEQVSGRAGFTDSALVRLLASLTDGNVPESGKSFSDLLSQWLGWTDAISLYSALNDQPATAQRDTVTTPGAEADSDEGEFARVRTALLVAIAEDSAFLRSDAIDTTTDFAPYRRRYLARQHTMALRIGPLRGRVRATLERRSPAMARLAAVDAVMEQALSGHEHRVMAGVPLLLEKYFKRLLEGARTAQAGQTAEEPGNERQLEAWLDRFRDDMQAVALAELDTRLQPVEGLLEALRKN